jgi:chromosomal replication initiation ATPase DnaA
VNRQLVLDLALRPALGRDDFLVTPSNAAAVAAIDQWPDWPGHAMLLLGPPGSGKTHLAEVFRQRSSAPTVEAGKLSIEQVPFFLQTRALVIENCDAGPCDERALFHALNVARQSGGHILLTASQPVSGWSLQLPDLISRLNAVPTVLLKQPDDELLRGVLIKHFNDRQIAVNENAITYLSQRIPRSLDSVRAIVAEIDRVALAERAEVTRPFIARLLSEFTNPAFFPDVD